jgi:hypothetical protein
MNYVLLAYCLVGTMSSENAALNNILLLNYSMQYMFSSNVVGSVLFSKNTILFQACFVLLRFSEYALFWGLFLGTVWPECCFFRTRIIFSYHVGFLSTILVRMM